jgi:UDP-glucose 4-epimerase
MKDTKVLVVGGAGFIGSHLVDAFIKERAIVTVVDNLFLGKEENLPKGIDLRKVNACNFFDMEETLQDVKPDLIYNLAVLPLPHSLEDPVANIDCNVAMITNLCELQREMKSFRLIHFSSSEVYGSARYAPMCEDHPLEASTPYAASKAAGDLICMSYVRTFGSDISILRPFNNYGPKQNAESYAGVIPLTIARLMKNESPIICGTGTQTRDYIYVEDTARAAVMMGQRPDLKGEIINIGSGHDIQIGWLVEEIRDLYLKMSGEETWQAIAVRPERIGDVRRHLCNGLKAKDVLGFTHKIGMVEGLQKTIRWYLDQGKNNF